jgi:hypothetical protein
MAHTWPRSGIEPPNPHAFVLRADWDRHEAKLMDDFSNRETSRRTFAICGGWGCRRHSQREPETQNDANAAPNQRIHPAFSHGDQKSIHPRPAFKS